MAEPSPAPSAEPERLTPRNDRRPRWRWAAALLLVAGLLLGAAVFGLPPLLHAQIERRGSEALGRELRLERVELSLRQLALTLHGLRIAGPAGSGEAQLDVERIAVDVDARSLWRFAPVLQSVRVERPRLRLAHLGDGRWDVDDIVRRLATPREPARDGEEPARFAVYNLQLQGGELRVDDQPLRRRHEVRGIL